VEGAGWLSGFRNMLRKENGSWIGTRRWLVQSVIWLLFVNGIVAMVLSLSSNGSQPQMGSLTTTELFFSMLGSVTPFGVIILTQSDVVGEKQSGTAEWVLSSPLSRESFLLSKLVANSAWVFAIVVFLQGAAFNLMLVAFGLPTVPVLNMVEGLTINCLHLLFWLTLALMLGVTFQSRGPVLGVSVAFLILQDLVMQLAARYAPWVIPLLPKSLMVQGLQLAQGGGLASIVPAAAVALWSIVFTAAAVWRFRREEF
jgi:ABC-type transport system involved in multi-copper enzyme maturation permease subunit